MGDKISTNLLQSWVFTCLLMYRKLLHQSSCNLSHENINKTEIVCKIKGFLCHP